MNNQHQPPAYAIHGMFPCPVYSTYKGGGLSTSEASEIAKVIAGGKIINQENISGKMR